MTLPAARAGRLVVVHLFPELLNLYGDLGNVRVLVRRAQWRGFDVEVRSIGANDARAIGDADIVFIGGGQDKQQIAVAHALERLGPSLMETIAEGASLLAVCGGFQNLGHRYRSDLVGDLRGPGLLDVATWAGSNTSRLVGGVVMRLAQDSPITALGIASARAAGHANSAGLLVGFENHSGRTRLSPQARPLGRVVVGGGNEGRGYEGIISMPGEGGLAGLRIGTYLHGPVLPRNPHLADFLILSAMKRRGITELSPLDDRAEWAAHAAFAAHWLSLRRPALAPSIVGRIAQRIDNLAGPSS